MLVVDAVDAGDLGSGVDHRGWPADVDVRRLPVGREGPGELLQRHPQVDAVFCSSDLLALGVMTEAHARGLAIPSRLGVVGFGNQPFAAGVIPSLATVHVDGTRIGRTAAHLLVERAEGREVRERIVDVGFSIVERGSA